MDLFGHSLEEVSGLPTAGQEGVFWNRSNMRVEIWYKEKVMGHCEIDTLSDEQVKGWLNWCFKPEDPNDPKSKPGWLWYCEDSKKRSNPNAVI